MVLFDLVGDCDLQLPREANSDPGLYAELEAVGARGSGSESAAPFGGEAPGIARRPRPVPPRPESRPST